MSTYPPPNSYPFGKNIQGDSFANAGNMEQAQHDRVQAGRTPSPTPSEAREMKTGVFDRKTMLRWQFWFRKEWWLYYIIFVVVLVLVGLMTIYHTQIVHWLRPAADWMHDLPAGWLIPIGVLFVISFPPLFGHEIVAVLCGLVWGLWVGFGIVAAGTFLGEVGNFYAFKYCCRARGEKLERTKITYACLARVVREGGFKIALIARLSAIPGHFTTAIFSTCGMGIFVFSLAAILSMPKQFITVYLGVILEQSDPTSGAKVDPKSGVISKVVLSITILITILACWYILKKMGDVKPSVIYDRRKARQVKLDRGSPPMMSNTEIFNPETSDSHLPLTAGGHFQQWDNQGRAVGYAGDPRLNHHKTTSSDPTIHAPLPQRANSHRMDEEMQYASQQQQYPYAQPSNNHSLYTDPNRPMYDEPASNYKSPLR